MVWKCRGLERRHTVRLTASARTQLREPALLLVLASLNPPLHLQSCGEVLFVMLAEAKHLAEQAVNHCTGVMGNIILQLLFISLACHYWLHDSIP